MTDKTFGVKIKKGHDFKVKCNIFITPEESFEEQFPSLIGEGKRSMIRLGSSLLNPSLEEQYVYLQKEIQQYCLDKQKVRDAIYKICILEIGEEQGNLDYRGIKLMQELGL